MHFPERNQKDKQSKKVPFFSQVLEFSQVVVWGRNAELGERPAHAASFPTICSHNQSTLSVSSRVLHIWTQ